MSFLHLQVCEHMAVYIVWTNSSQIPILEKDVDF